MRFLTAVALVMLWVPVDGVAQEDPPEINNPDRIPLYEAYYKYAARLSSAPRMRYVNHSQYLLCSGPQLDDAP